MVDILVWMTTYYVCLFGHVGLLVAGIYGFVVGGRSRSMDNTLIFMIPIMMAAIYASRKFATLGTMLQLEQPSPDSTSESHRFKKQHELVLTTVLDVIFLAIDISLAGLAGSKRGQYKEFTPMCIFASIAAVTVLATTVVDVLKVHELRQQKREVDDVLNSLEPYQDEP